MAVTVSHSHQNAQRFQFLHVVTGPCPPLMVAVPVGVEWHLVAVWICICLTMSDAEHLFMGARHLWRNVYLSPLPTLFFFNIFY